MAGAPADLHIVDAGGTHELATVELLHRQGYFEQLGVRVRRTYVTNGADAADLVLSGACDAAIQIGFGPALAAINAGAPLRVIAAANLLTVHAIYSRQSDIRSLRDLAGRTLGIGKHGALVHQLAYAALLKAGVDPSTVRFVTIGNSAAIFRALLAGQIDAGFGETDVFDHQAKYGVHALDGGALWRELPHFPNQASFANLAALEGKRDTLVRVLAAHALLYRCLHNPQSWPLFDTAWRAALPGAHDGEGRSQWDFYQAHHPFAADLMLPEASLAYLQDLNVRMGPDKRCLESCKEASLRTFAKRVQPS